MSNQTLVRKLIITRRAVTVVLVLIALWLARNYILGVGGPAPAPLSPPVRSSLSIPSERALDTFAVSPDGRWLAYSAETTSGQLRLFVRSLDGSGERDVDGSTGARNPFFAPDGNRVAYFARGAIWTTGSAVGSASQKVCDAPTESAGGTWTADDRIVFAPLGGLGLMAVPAAGGSPAALTRLNTRERELAHGWPHALPKGGIVFTASQTGRDAHLETLSASNVRGRRLVPAVGQAEYVSTGHLVYSYLGDLLAVPFDADELTTRGVPVALAKGIQSSGEFDELGHSGFAVSLRGTLAWRRSSAQDQLSSLVRVGFGGATTPLGGASESYQTPRLSADGKRLAVVLGAGWMTRAIRILDAAHPDRVLSTIEGGDNQSPAWMPDGRLSFASNRDGLQKIYVLGAASKANRAAAVPLFSTDGSSPRNPASWVHSPPLLALYEIEQFRSRDVLVYRVGEAILPVAATSANERSPWLAPDGRSIAYVSDTSGRDEVYVKRLDTASDARQVSKGGGTEPVWTRAGLLYRAGDRMMLDDRVLFDGRFEHDPAANLAAYDVDPKGRFLVMLKKARSSQEIRIVKNWGTELTQVRSKK